MRRPIQTALAFTLALLAAVTLTRAWEPAPPPGLPGQGGGDGGRTPFVETDFAAALLPYEDCAQFESAVRAAAIERLGPWGLDSGMGFWGGRVAVDEAVALDVAESSTAAGGVAGIGGAASGGGGGEGTARQQEGAAAADGEVFSGTNVQERGVDEPDLVKTDGRLLATVTQGVLRLVDLTGPAPRLAADVPLPQGWGHELLLHEGRLLVTSNAERFATEPSDPSEGDLRIAPPHTPQAVLTLFDVSDADAPRELGSLRLDGEAVTSRMVDGTARLVLRSQPQPAFAMPEPRREPASAQEFERLEQSALERNKRIVEESEAADWLPRYERLDADGTVTQEAPLVACDEVHRSVGPVGFGMVSVLAVPLEAPLAPTGTASVAADGQTVYATPERLYVAMQHWVAEEPVEEPRAERPAGPDEPVSSSMGIAPAPPHRVRTAVHEFDISDPRTPRYTASGDVPGQILNQWALSAHDGHLRIATTEDGVVEPTPGQAVPQTESAVRVLRREGDKLVQVGAVGGLGKGERIYAVRYFGDIGFVVTFRQTDPLYTLDLADPAAPRVVGELKIPGFSSYLHPVGDGLLLGVGQDADEQTGRRLGVQVSLFDVSDLAAPKRVANAVLEQSSSTEVEHDHRAFLWWGPERRAVLPYQRHHFDERTQREDVFVGAVAFDVGRSSVAEAGRLTHTRDSEEPWLAQIRRALVVGDTLYTVSERGLLASDVATLAERSWMPFPGSGQKGEPGGRPMPVD
jgi:hypothetical protein